MDGRLQLDDDGLPLDSRAGDLVVDDAGEPTSGTGRPLDALLTGPTARSTLVRRSAAAGLVGVLAALLLVSTRSTAPLPTAADVHGVSARVVASTDASATPRILASYAVSPRSGSAAVRIVGLDGDAVANAVEARSDSGTQSFVVEPACDRVLSTGSSYELVVSPADDPSATTGITAFDGADALTAAAVRACWGAVASQSLRVVSVAGRAGRGPWAALDVVLRNSGNLPLSVTAVDVANVDTLSMADSQLIAPRSSTSIHVRLPIATCSGATLPTPTALTWSVGPPGDAPSAFALTTLTERQRTAVASAERARCGTPPGLTVTVLSSTAVRDDASMDVRGLSISLRVRVVTEVTGPVLLGDDPSRLTSDARPVFGSATVRPVGAPVDAVLVWHTRCGATTDDRTLPAATTVDGLDYAWAAPITGASLPALRDAACR